MRRIDPQYHVVIDPEQRLPSWMVALLPAGADDPGVTAAIAHLEGSDLDVVDRSMAAEREMEGSRWELEVEIRWEEDREPVAYRLWLEPGVRRAKGRMQAIEAELDRHRRFTGMDRLRFEAGWLREV